MNEPERQTAEELREALSRAFPTTAAQHLTRAANFLRDCSGNDPCDYDNTCFAHKARWHIREALRLIEGDAS